MRAIPEWLINDLLPLPLPPSLALTVAISKERAPAMGYAIFLLTLRVAVEVTGGCLPAPSTLPVK